MIRKKKKKKQKRKESFIQKIYYLIKGHAVISPKIQTIKFKMSDKKALTKRKKFKKKRKKSLIRRSLLSNQNTCKDISENSNNKSSMSKLKQTLEKKQKRRGIR